MIRKMIDFVYQAVSPQKAFPLETVQERLQMWLDVETSVAAGQSYEIDKRKFTRANLAEVREQIKFWKLQETKSIRCTRKKGETNFKEKKSEIENQRVLDNAIIGGKECCGKTYELIKKSNKDWLYIVCANQNQAKDIAMVAKSMGLDIPYPITVDEFLISSRSNIKGVLVDEIEQILEKIIKCPIVTASTSLHMKEMDFLVKGVEENIRHRRLYGGTDKSAECCRNVGIKAHQTSNIEFI